MKTRFRIPILLLIAAVLALALTAAGCGDDDDDGGDTTGAAAGEELDTKEPGTLIVGSDIPFPPFELGREPNYDGYDIDLVNEIAERLDLEVQIEDTGFAAIFRDLAQDKFDMVVAATTITPEREKIVDFSNPYYFADQSLLVEEGSDVQSQDDLAGATVGAQDGTTGETYANDETDAEEVRGFPTGPGAINALRAGTVDAVIIDLPVAEDAVEKQGGVEIAEEIVTREEYGLVLQQDADELREAVNTTLQEIKDDGTYEKIYEEWFKEKPDSELLDATHEPT
ncbi:MAG: basic amino acid ABC transporter substrate-binding protein [Gaiellaceae bacterium]